MLSRRVLTRTPQLLALLLVGEAHAVVAVGLATFTGGAIHLVEVGGAVGRLARAELWEVTLPGLLTTQGARSQELSQRMRQKKQLDVPSHLNPISQGLLSIILVEQNYPFPSLINTFHMISLAQDDINLPILTVIQDF